MSIPDPDYTCPCGQSFFSKPPFQEHIKTCPEFKEFVSNTMEIVDQMDELRNSYNNPDDLK